jgi:oxygen-independent coproporphyrinogen-3 oxidase
VNGAYVHVPFCDKLCRFCPFNKRETDERLIAEFVEALIIEIELYSEVVTRRPLDFVYFGGGTPSVLGSSQLARILEAMDRGIGSVAESEITLECHPTHLNDDYCTEIKGIGINRISTGIQSFNDKRLIALGAQHRSRDTRRAIEAASKIFGRVGIDLLYRCKDQSLDEWSRELSCALEVGSVDHISCYSLVLKSVAGQPDRHLDAQMACQAVDQLTSGGFTHYASCASGGLDFAKNGAECAYEADHWKAPQSSHLGLGPGAFGFLNGSVTVNGLHIDGYLSVLRDKLLPLASVRQVSIEELMRRYFVLGTKLLNVPLAPFEEKFGIHPIEKFGGVFDALAQEGLIELDHVAMKLTPIGRLFTDQISASFYSEAEKDIVHPEEPQIRRTEILARKMASKG